MDYRPLTLEDAPAVHAVIRRWEKYWKAPLVTPLDEIVDDLEAPHLDRESDTVGVWDDGDLVAYGWIWHRPSGHRIERAEILTAIENGLTRKHWRPSTLLSRIIGALPRATWRVSSIGLTDRTSGST